MGEPDCPIRQIVEPTTGEAAGDRVLYSLFDESMYFSPSTTYWKSYWQPLAARAAIAARFLADGSSRPGRRISRTTPRG
jgi:methyl coenzyme M reductase gamma subunit